MKLGTFRVMAVKGYSATGRLAGWVAKPEIFSKFETFSTILIETLNVLLKNGNENGISMMKTKTKNLKTPWFKMLSKTKISNPKWTPTQILKLWFQFRMKIAPKSLIFDVWYELSKWNQKYNEFAQVWSSSVLVTRFPNWTFIALTWLVTILISLKDGLDCT